MGMFFFWLLMAIITAIVASNKGHSGFGFFLYGLLIWPIALVHALVMKPASGYLEKVALATGGKRCPRCAEVVKSAAMVCRFCGHDFPPPTIKAPPSARAPRPDYENDTH